MDLDDIDYDNLPEDPQQAFLVIERVIRQNLYDRIRNCGDERPPMVPYFDYINNLRAAADELGLSFLDEYENLCSRVFPRKRFGTLSLTSTDTSRARESRRDAATEDILSLSIQSLKRKSVTTFHRLEISSTQQTWTIVRKKPFTPGSQRSKPR